MTTYGTIPTASTDSPSGLEFISRAKEQVIAGLGTRRPWKEMIDLHTINLPSSFNEGLFRIRANTSYFLMNYAIIVLLVLFLSLLWHPISLIVFIVMMGAWLFLYFLRDEPLVILHRTIDDWVVLAVLSIVTIAILLLTQATINILVSVLIGVVIVLIHAAFRKTDDLFVDEEAVESGGFLAVGDAPKLPLRDPSSSSS